MSEQELAPTTNVEDVNIDELKSKLEELTSQNERLLYESKKFKTRKSDVDELRAELESYKKKELEQKGDWQSRLEMERKQREELQAKLEARDKEVLKSNIFNAVSNYAKDAHDVNDLLAQRDYASMIEIDEEKLAPTKESIHKFVDSLKEEKKYLFKGHKVASMADTKPTMEKPVQKTIKQLSQKEREDKMKELLSSLGHNR